jgi:hypothetical protein
MAEISRFAESLNEEFRNKSQLVEKYFSSFPFPELPLLFGQVHRCTLSTSSQIEGELLREPSSMSETSIWLKPPRLIIQTLHHTAAELP